MNLRERILGRPEQSNGELVILPLRKRDVKIAMPLESAAYETSWSRAVFEGEVDRVADGSRYYVAAWAGRELVGYAGVWIVPNPDGDEAHVTNVVVKESHRRRGIARRLMLALAWEVIQRGCKAWTLEVREGSTGAQALYRSFGFAPAGVRKAYYENREDAIVMWCHDIHTDEYAARLEALAS